MKRSTEWEISTETVNNDSEKDCSPDQLSKAETVETAGTVGRKAPGLLDSCGRHAQGRGDTRLVWRCGALHARNFGPLTLEALEGRETRAETVVSEAEAAVLHMK